MVEKQSNNHLEQLWKVRFLYYEAVLVRRRRSRGAAQFSLYEKADKQVVHDLISTFLQSEEDGTSVEIQKYGGWIKQRFLRLLKKCNNPVLKTARKCIRRSISSKYSSARAQGEDKKVEEQHSYHLYDYAVKQEDQLLHDLISRILQE